MKKLNIVTGIVVALLSPMAGATTIAGIDLAAFADTVSGSSGVFNNWSSATSADVVDFAQVTADLTDVSPATYVLSMTPGAYVDMSFSGTPVYNGADNDLALFFVGNGDQFSIEINGFTHTYNPQTPPVPTMVSDPYGSYNLTVALINLDDFGLSGSSATLGNMRIFLDDATRPSLSLVGGFHTSISNVPLPLPALLFASGLGILGVFGRKRG